MKGIAIIGVVAGHAGVSQWTEAFVNQWHLATFFFVSGMCFKEKHLNTPLLYVKRRVASLYVPFVEFGIAFLLLHNIFYFLNFTGNEYSIGDMIKELFNLTIRLTSSEQLMGAMWFCPALLITTLIFFFALKLNTKPLIISKLQPIWGGGNFTALSFYDWLYGYTITH